MQTLYLTATDMNLGGCAIGTGNVELFARMTGQDFHAKARSASSRSAAAGRSATIDVVPSHSLDNDRRRHAAGSAHRYQSALQVAPLQPVQNGTDARVPPSILLKETKRNPVRLVQPITCWKAI